MSEPPATTPPVSTTTVIRRGITRRNALLIVLVTLALSVAYLLIDIALDPALLSHAARAGRLPVLLVLVGFGFSMGFGILLEVEAKRSRVERALNLLSILLLGPMLPIWSIVWLDPFQPNIRYAGVMFTGFGLGTIGFTLFGLSLLYGLLMARGRYTSEGSYAERGVPGREEIVGLGSLVWVATGVWLLAVVSASIYGMWLSLTNPLDNATLLMSFTVLCSALVLSMVGVGWIMVGVGWIWWHTGRYARQTRDTALLASTTVPSAKRAEPQHIVVPPDERPRWGINLLVGLGLVAVSMLTFAVLDFHYVQSANVNGTPGWLISWLISLFPAFFSWTGLHRASARRYQLERFQRLLVAAAMFVIAGDALMIDITQPRYAIVPPLGLLAIAVLCSTFGALICRSLLLYPMWEGNTEQNGAMLPMPAASYGAPVAGGQKRPRAAPYLVLLLPLLFVVEHLLVYGDASVREDWERLAFSMVMPSVVGALASVVDTDMPQRRAQRPAKKWRVSR